MNRVSFYAAPHRLSITTAHILIVMLVCSSCQPTDFVLMAKGTTDWKSESGKDFNGTGSSYNCCTFSQSGPDPGIKLSLVNDWIQRTNKGPPIFTASSSCAIGVNNQTLLFGGGDTWIFNASTNIWTNMNPPRKPVFRFLPCMAPIYDDDKVVLFGGDNYPVYLNDTWIYDLSDNEWTLQELPDSPPARAVASMAFIYNGDSLVLFGGEYNATLFRDTWIYNITSNRWRQVFPMNSPSARELAAAATVPNTNKIMVCV